VGGRERSIYRSADGYRGVHLPTIERRDRREVQVLRHQVLTIEIEAIELRWPVADGDQRWLLCGQRAKLDPKAS